VLYSFNLVTGKDSVLLNFNDTNGANPTGIIIVKNGLDGVNTIKEEKSLIVVYPNPFKDIATIIFGENGKHFVAMYDVNGREVKYLTCTGKQAEITRDNLTTGVYFLKVYNGAGQFIASSKIVVQ
jgi:hypothetical protein